MEQGGRVRSPDDRARRLAEAQAAASAGDWDTARAIYAELVAVDASPSGPLLQAWSAALKNTGVFPEALRATERAYRAFVEAGDHRGAARCTTQITGFRMVSGDRAGARA